MEERILNELRELALIYKRRKCRNPKSSCANRYTKEQKLAVVEAYVKDHVPIYELSQEFGVSDVSIWRWVRNFTPENVPLYTCNLRKRVKTISPMPKKQAKETANEELQRLREENKRLSEALRMAEWMNHAKDVMIDEAEKTFNIPIRKKSGAKR